MERSALSERLGFAISELGYARLTTYVALLLQWNKAYNLIGKGTETEIWERHIVDALQLLPLLPDSPELILLDAGTGAGIPGLILACARPGRYHLVDSNGKKCRFLTHAARTLFPSRAQDEHGVTIDIHHERIERLPPLEPNVITARAFAGLTDMLALLPKQLSHETLCLFPKGENYTRDVEALRSSWQCDITVHPSLSHSGSVCLAITHITPITKPE